jgi:MFS family permease
MAPPLPRFELPLLLSSGMCMALIFVAISPVLPGMAAHFGGAGGGAFLAQMAMTLPGIGLIIGGLLTGWLVERRGPRGVLAFGLAMYAATGAAGLVADNATALLASRWLLGFAAAGLATSTTAVIGSRFDGVQRERLLGYQNACASIMGVVAILAAGTLGEGGGWRAPFALYPLLALPLLALLALPRTAGGFAPQAARAARAAPESGGASLPPMVWALLLLTVLLFAAAFMTGAQASFLLAENGISTPSVLAIILGCASLGNAVGSVIYGQVSPALSRAHCMALALLLLGAGLAALGSIRTPLLAALSCALAGLGSGLLSPWVASTLIECTPAPVRARAFGLLYAAIFIGDFLNPVLLTPIARTIGLHATFIVVGALLLGAAATTLLLRPGRSRRAATP